MPLKSMTIQIPEDDVAYLRLRLQQTRWPSPVASSGWFAGTDADYLRALVDHWANHYNWREHEARLNRFDHFIADVGGTTIHLIRAVGQGPNPVPLLLIQGWPSSFVQMLDIIPLLTKARDDGMPCFDVVAASLPGYPFSSFPS
jgi:hypothetical protein